MYADTSNFHRPKKVILILIYNSLLIFKEYFMLNEKSMSEYQSLWERRSSIRSRPRKIIDFEQPGYFFPKSKQPLLLEQLTSNTCQNSNELILLHSFRKYLYDIVKLESKMIIKACNLILDQQLAIDFMEEIKLNALTIIIDEYYHIYVAQDLMSQIDAHFQFLEPIEYYEPDAYLAVNKVKTNLDNSHHNIFEIIAVCIFETTLIRELVEFFNDEGLNPCIKSYVNDHMNDEARHYNFFKNLLADIWKKITQEEKNAIGKQIPSFIKSYLNIESEKKFNHDLLLKLTQCETKAHETIEALYKGFEVTPEIPIVKNVLRILRESQILDHDLVQTGFAEINWKIA